MTHEDTVAGQFARARSGDRGAFETLVAGTRERLARGIAGLLATQGGRRPDAKDIIQETYLRAFQALPKIEWRGAAHFDRWLGAIARNLIFGAARRERRCPELRLDADPAADPLSQATVLRRKERFERLRAALADLSEDHRQVILLARIEELTTEEIARRMDRSPTAVRNLLLRAMRELKKSFGDTESFGLPPESLSPKRPTDDR